MATTKASKSPTAILTPTPLNVWVLGRIAAGRREFPNRISPTSAAHLRRCMRAGLVEVVDRTRLRITDAGHVAIVDQIATDQHSTLLIPDGEFTDEVVS
jgi:hypothetical protein